MKWIRFSPDPPTRTWCAPRWRDFKFIDGDTNLQNCGYKISNLRLDTCPIQGCLQIQHCVCVCVFCSNFHQELKKMRGWDDDSDNDDGQTGGQKARKRAYERGWQRARRKAIITSCPCLSFLLRENSPLIEKEFSEGHIHKSEKIALIIFVVVCGHSRSFVIIPDYLWFLKMPRFVLFYDYLW